MVNNMQGPTNGKKMNPLFSRPKTETVVAKQLNEIAEKPKRVVRKDWTPRLAKDEDIIESNDIKPSLAADGDIIEVVKEEDKTTPATPVTPSDKAIPARENNPLLPKSTKDGFPLKRSAPVVPVSSLAKPTPVVNDEVKSTTPGSSSTKPNPSPAKPLLGNNSEIREEFGSRRDDAVRAPVAPKERPARVLPPVASKRRDSIFLGSNEVATGRTRVAPEAVQPSGDVESQGDTNTPKRTVEPVTARVTPVRNPVATPRRTGLSEPKDESLHVDQRASVLKAKPGIDVEDWTKDDTTDTDRGFGGENDKAHVEPELGAGFHLTERDITIIRFLARYRYAYNFQIARLVRTSVKGIRPRLKTLADRGFIRKQVVTGSQHIWLSTKAGNLVADIDLVPIKKGELSWATVAHTLGLVNIGIELETGGENLLKEEVWPTMNNMDVRGRIIPGERVVTEKEIRAGQQKWRMNRTTSDMREVIDEALRDAGDTEINELTGEIEYILPPESLEGNEGLFVIYAPTGEHIPDMVVSRGRDSTGKPINIAIELELHEKTHADWRRILKAYKEHGDMYDKVIYFTQKRNISNQLQKINNADVHLPADKFMIRKYIPKNEREPFWG
jgi:hypothetical protein